MLSSKSKNILLVSGSLRSGSSNHSILEFLVAQVLNDTRYIIYEGLAQLPHFDPGLDNNDPPYTVIAFRKLITEANGIIICTPEYAYGIPGSLKNALDWLVSSGSMVSKPLMLVTASTGGETAHAAMLLVLGALSANTIKESTLLISYVRSKIDATGKITDKKTRKELETAFIAFYNQL